MTDEPITLPMTTGTAPAILRPGRQPHIDSARVFLDERVRRALTRIVQRAQDEANVRPSYSTVLRAALLLLDTYLQSSTSERGEALKRRLMDAAGRDKLPMPRRNRKTQSDQSH